MHDVSVTQDEHYKKDFEGNEVFVLTTKRNGMGWSRTYTVPELQEIANVIITFLEKRNASIES